MPTLDNLAARKEQLIAQSELDRMRVEHAVLGVRESFSPALRFGGGSPLRLIAGGAVALALPLLAAGRRSGLLRVASIALGVVRTLRRLFRR
ncbi:MAG: hypothetical protein BroJett026_29280 [Betaproteobacteria bacterium]|nr:MAG: hypothetical protein BroJett026_29280 [Betaproteobacteria bacterium]